MTNVTTGQEQDVAELSAADEQVLRELTERARAGGLKLTGEGGLLGKLTKMVVEGALEGELDDHLGYGKHDPEGRDGGNSRNGRRAKTVLTETGPVEIPVPRDRDSSFEPKIVAKRQRRLTGVDEMVISLSAKGLTHGEIAAHLAEVYGAEVSKQTITTITDRVMDGLAEWQNRPLDPVYAVIFIDAINVKIREGQVANRPIYLALGVTVDGERDVLGLWAGEHGDGEGAKFWLRVLSEIKNRGVADVCMLVCDGLKGLPDAVSTVGEKTIVQHVSFISCGIPSSTPRRGTGRRSRKTSGRFTPRHPNPRRWTGSPNSPGNGRSATRRSSGCGRTRGRNSCRSCGSTGKSGPSSARQMPSSRSMPGCGAR